jgi:membrane-associated phospholipid phosphatase
MKLVARSFSIFLITGIELCVALACVAPVCAGYQVESLAYQKRDTILTHFMQTLIQDMLYFNKYLFFTPDTYKILMLSGPLYMAGRAVDKPTHNYFYNAQKHKNIHTIAPVFKYSVDPIMGVSITTLLLLQIISKDPHARRVSQVFLAALPFLSLYKDVLKTIHIKGALRPKNECFSADKTFYGGFPSGHMWEAAFMTYLFGAELGPNFAVPLSAFSLLVAAQSVAINRHTVSQVVAGAALGVAFGVASQKVVHRALHDGSAYGILINKSGGASFTFEKTF